MTRTAKRRNDEPAGATESVAAYECGIDELRVAVTHLTPERDLGRPVAHRRVPWSPRRPLRRPRALARPRAAMRSLCETCENVRGVRTARSLFLLCELSLIDARFPKYPPQPVVRCDGHRPGGDPDGGNPGDQREDGSRSG